MAVDVPVVLGSSTWTIPASTIAAAITFERGSEGSYGPQIDETRIRDAVVAFAASVSVPATEPVVLGQTAATIYVGGGAPGRTLDVDATTRNVLVHLAALERGETAPQPQMVTIVVPTQVDKSGKTVVNLSQVGAWTVRFVPGISNGDGANIRLPAQYIDGTIVTPGEQFSFWKGVGPVTFDRGFKMGGVIQGGHSNYTGAIGGGICSASTTLFNAALRAGLQIDERHYHAYYIDRYPAGLDATVFMDESTVQDMKFTNDMATEIVIRGYSTETTVTFEIWGVPDGRKVTITQGPKTDYSPASTTTVRVNTLPAGRS